MNAPTVGGTWSVQVHGLHVLTVNDVEDIVAAATTHLGVEVTTTRAVVSDVGMVDDTGHLLNLRSASDADNSRVMLRGGLAFPAGQGEFRGHLGSDLAASFFVEWWEGLSAQAPANDAAPDGDAVRAPSAADRESFAKRLAEILNGSRRRIPEWRWAQFAIVAIVVALFVVWASFAVSVWPNVWAGIVGAFGTWVFGRWAIEQLRVFRLRRPHLVPNVGRVVIDATLRDQVRTDRANRRRDLKVAVISAVGGILVTLVGIGVTNLLD